MVGYILGAASFCVKGEEFNDSQPHGSEEIQPYLLKPPVELPRFEESTDPLAADDVWPFLQHPPLATTGFSGPSGVLPSEPQQSSHFVPVEDRWRIGFPNWDRSDADRRIGHDLPYQPGQWWDPYNQHVLKGDYPLVGQHVFVSLTGSLQSLVEPRQIPNVVAVQNPPPDSRLSDPDQLFSTNFFRLQINVTHGNGAFKPVDWQVRITPAFNLNAQWATEPTVLSPDGVQGSTRLRTDVALDEWWAECKLADLSADYDFLSLRAGSQFFNSDFRGMIFSDVNRGVRLYGTSESYRNQYNLVVLNPARKDINSLLNTFDGRNQLIVIANAYRQDFLVPGYIGQLSFHFNDDGNTPQTDQNGFPVQPSPVGQGLPHRVQAGYFGWAGDGHLGRLNLSHASYWVLGRDSFNPFANRAQTINAQMASGEASLDFDWTRLRTSLLWASGDHDPQDGQARGFDTILDNPNFAGGQFSYWQRQQLRRSGISLVNRFSLIPNLRTNKFQGQSNFVNPGLMLVNLGSDYDLTTKLRLIQNVNFLWFDQTEVLKQLISSPSVHRSIGTDVSLGMEYRPFLNNQVILVGGIAGLIPGQGLKDFYSAPNRSLGAMSAGFLEVNLTW